MTPNGENWKGSHPSLRYTGSSVIKEMCEIAMGDDVRAIRAAMRSSRGRQPFVLEPAKRLQRYGNEIARTMVWC